MASADVVDGGTGPARPTPDGRVPDGRVPDGRVPDGRTAAGRTAAGRGPEVAVGLAAAAVIVLNLADAMPHGLGQWAATACSATGTLLLVAWRTSPRPALAIGPLLLLVQLVAGPEPSNFLLLVVLAYAALAADQFSGRAAWWAGAACAGYLALIYVLSGVMLHSAPSIGLAMLTVPGFVAGTALRLRRQTGAELAERGRELERERDLFTELTVRNERARIAAELHDIVGHAVSVMVIQAAAGQRLVDRAPDEAAASLSVIADSARQGRADLRRLIELLSGSDVSSPDVALLEELVSRAARSGLPVTLRLEGDRGALPTDVAHVAYRVVQESLTNALRYAQGAPVRVLVRGGRVLTARVENDPAPCTVEPVVTGSGRGLAGLRERVAALGGTFTAGPTAGGGWAVEAVLTR